MRAGENVTSHPIDRHRACALITTLVVLLIAAVTLTPLTSTTYLSWDATDEPRVSRLHWLALFMHCASVLLAEVPSSPALPLPHRRALGAAVFLLTSIAWNSKVHVLTSVLRTTAYLNETPLFALMDFSHAVCLALHVLRSFRLRHPLTLFLTIMIVEHHTVGLIGTFFGWLPLRQTIHFLYPQNIDMSETQHEPASSAFPFRLFVPDALYPTVREVLFQSDVVGHLALQLALAAATVQLIASQYGSPWKKHD